MGQIWLSNVQCSGGESRLDECTSSSGVEDFRCYHNADAGVRCQASSGGKSKGGGGGGGVEPKYY